MPRVARWCAADVREREESNMRAMGCWVGRHVVSTRESEQIYTKKIRSGGDWRARTIYLTHLLLGRAVAHSFLIATATHGLQGDKLGDSLIYLLVPLQRVLCLVIKRECREIRRRG